MEIPILVLTNLHGIDKCGMKFRSPGELARVNASDGFVVNLFKTTHSNEVTDKVPESMYKSLQKRGTTFLKLERAGGVGRRISILRV